MADIRPMSFGEMLDGSLKLYRNHFGIFLQVAIASLAVPAALIIYFVMTKMEALQMMMVGGMMMGPAGLDWSLLGFMLVIGIAYGLGTLMLQAAAIRIVSDSYLGRSTTFGQAIGTGASKILPLFLVGLGKGILLGILGAIIGGGSFFSFILITGQAGATVGGLTALAFAILGCWLWIWIAAGYGVTTPVVVIEQLRSAFDAFGRSWDLTRGSRAKIVGLWIVATLLFNVVPQTILQVVSAALVASNAAVAMVFMVLSYIVPVILYPAISCVITLMYYDLRVRREAFDLQMLSQQLGV
jgi:hypothetical protein